MNRNAGLDILRTVSCFLVVCIHSCLNYTYGQDGLNNSLALFGQSLFRIGLPVFFMLSGYFMLNDKCDFSIIRLYKRIKKIVIPFLMFGFIHWFFINQKADLSWETIIGFIKALTVRNEISVHFWFVYSIIGLYIISQPMNYLFKNIGPVHAGFAILIIGLLIMYNGDLVSLSHVLPIPGIDKWASYFIAGGLIARIKKNVSLKQCALTAIFGYLLIVLLSVLNGANKTPMPYDNSISMFITCCGVVLFFSKIPAQESVLIKN